jgi:hypothetical protein
MGAGFEWHDGWFGDWHHDWFGLEASGDVPGSGPDGVGTFVLELQNGYTVTLRYVTDIIKTRSGKEQRISRNDSPRESYQGKVLLLGDTGAEIRTQLAEHAAKGLPFLLALPHEELTFREDSVGTSVYVSTTGKSDWRNAGQRVVCKRAGVGVDAVIQSRTADSFTLDVEPGDLGKYGGSILPTMPVLLEPEQAFPRYRVGAEQWDLRARAASFDFAGTRATISLDAFAPGLAGNVVAARAITLEPRYLRMEPGLGYPNAGQISAETSSQTTFQYKNGVTTIGDLATALESSALFVMTTVDDPATVITTATPATLEATGADTRGPIGTGATVEEYADRPLWDRRLKNEGTIVDSIQAMTEIIDHDGVPYALGWADMADWGRAVHYQGNGLDSWQWLKLFLATVKGRQKSFWLSTWRADLPFVSKAAGTITVRANVRAWWPLQRQHVQIVETNETVTRAEVTAALDNGDGTWTLTIGTTLATSSVRMVSWLELCRFTWDEFPITFNANGHSLKTVATVVQPDDIEGPESFAEYEASREASEPRELVTIVCSSGQTYRHTSASRDILQDGNVFTAIPVDRGVLAITMPGAEKELTVSLPIDHALATRYVAQGTPPKRITVTIQRLQDSHLDTIWVGDVTSMSVEGGQAVLLVPSRAGQWMMRTIGPTIGSECPHVLYSTRCGVDRNGNNGGLTHKVTTTVLALTGRFVTIDLDDIARKGTWAVGGEMTFNGESMTVLAQDDLVPFSLDSRSKLTLEAPLIGLAVGATITLMAGCDHTLTGDGGCHARFDNRHNYGGAPYLPTKNIFLPGSFGWRSLFT